MHITDVKCVKGLGERLSLMATSLQGDPFFGFRCPTSCEFTELRIGLTHVSSLSTKMS